MGENLSPVVGNEQLDHSLQRSTELERDEKRLIAEVVRMIGRQYEVEYAKFGVEEDWQSMSKRIESICNQTTEAIMERYPNHAHLLDSVNRMYGLLPEHCVLPQIELLEANADLLTSEQRNDLRINAAEWQSDAIRALFTFSNLRLERGSDRTVLDEFYQLNRYAHLTAFMKGHFPDTENLVNMDDPSRRLKESDMPKIAERLTGVITSGVFGPLVTARVLSNRGYEVWLPKASQDVKYKTDLIYGKKLSYQLPEHFYLGQCKSYSGIEEGLEVTSNPINLSSKEEADWRIIQNFASRLSRDAITDNSGVDFSAKWITIQHSGLGTTEAWQSTLDYLDEEAQPGQSEGEFRTYKEVE